MDHHDNELSKRIYRPKGTELEEYYSSDEEQQEDDEEEEDEEDQMDEEAAAKGALLVGALQLATDHALAARSCGPASVALPWNPAAVVVLYSLLLDLEWLGKGPIPLSQPTAGVVSVAQWWPLNNQPPLLNDVVSPTMQANALLLPLGCAYGNLDGFCER